MRSLRNNASIGLGRALLPACLTYMLFPPAAFAAGLVVFTSTRLFSQHIEAVHVRSGLSPVFAAVN